MHAHQASREIVPPFLTYRLAATAGKCQKWFEYYFLMRDTPLKLKRSDLAKDAFLLINANLAGEFQELFEIKYGKIEGNSLCWYCIT